MHTLIPKEKWSKLDKKTVQGIFVGYSDRTKGYRIYLPESNKVVISTSLVFDELEAKERANTDSDEEET